MGRHVVHVPGIGAERRERIGGGHRALGLVGHLERVDQDVGDRRVLRLPGRVGQRDRPFADGDRLDGVGATGRPPGFDIPQSTRGPGNKGFGEQRHDVMVVGIVVVYPPHFGRVIVVPAVVFVGGNGMGLLKAASERLYQPIFDVGGVGREGARLAYVVTGKGDRRRSLLLAELPPGEVVERPRAVGHAPMRHDASGVGFEGLLEAFDSFLMVEAEAPIQTEIEPALRLGRTGGNMSRVTPEVEICLPCHLGTSALADRMMLPHALSRQH